MAYGFLSGALAALPRIAVFAVIAACAWGWIVWPILLVCQRERNLARVLVPAVIGLLLVLPHLMFLVFAPLFAFYGFN